MAATLTHNEDKWNTKAISETFFSLSFNNGLPNMTEFNLTNTVSRRELYFCTIYIIYIIRILFIS